MCNTIIPENHSSLLVEKNQRKSQSSKVFQLQTNCHTAHSLLAVRMSKIPSTVLSMRTSGMKGPTPSTNVYQSRKSDIENERLPPELYDADSEEGKAMMSQPSSPSEDLFEGEEASISSHMTANGVSEQLESAIEKGTLSRIDTSQVPSRSTPPSPSSPVTKKRHSRNASLGTTMSSPSTRRRSLESTYSLIQNVWSEREREEAERAKTNNGNPTPPP